MTAHNGYRSGRQPWVSYPLGPQWRHGVLSLFKRYAEGGAMATRQAARAEVVVEAPPEEAFRIFTDEIGLWWRRDTRYWNDRERGLTIRIEPRVGGRFLEVYELERCTGFEAGRVTAWEPGERLGLTWTQVGWPEGVSTDIEVTFEPVEGGTLVRLEQTGFEQLPDGAVTLAGYDAGWKEVLGWYAERANAHGR